MILSGRRFNDYVTITSLDVHNRATFGYIEVSGSSHIRVDSINLIHPMRAGEAEWSRAFEVNTSDHIQITNSKLSGSDDGIPDNDIYGFYSATNTDLYFYNNDVSNFVRGAIMGGGDRLTLCGNSFRKMRSDGIDLGGVVDTLVQANRFTDFYQYGQDHPDAIQAWNDNGVRTMENVTIRGNVILRGPGDVIQAIFIQSNTPAFPNRNFVIDHNLIYQGHIHGISIADTQGVLIDHNTVLTDFNPVLVESINTSQTTNAVISNNVSTAFGSYQDTNRVLINNVVAQNSDPRLPTHYDRLFLNANAGPQAIVDDFRPRPGSLLIQTGEDIGALEFDFHPSVLTAYILTDPGFGPAPLGVYFDGSLSTGPTGTITNYQWDFRDGQTGTGATISHAFTNPGTYFVKLTVTTDLGASAFTEKTVIVTQPASPDLPFYLNMDDNYLDNSGYNHTVNCSGDCPPFVTGHSGKGLAFDGTASGPFLNVPYRYQLDGMSQLTLAFWAKSNLTTGGGTVLHKHIGYWAQLANGVFSGYLFNAAGTRFDYSAPVPQDTNWHHFAMAFDGSNVRLYVDGNLVATQPFTNGISIHSDRDLLVGKDPWGNAFNGTLDEVRIYARGLSAAEIQNLAH